MFFRSRSHVNASVVLTRADHLFIYNYIRLLLNISLRVCFWSNTGGAQLVETNIECVSSTTSATATTSAITNTSIYVWIYLYLNNIK